MISVSFNTVHLSFPSLNQFSWSQAHVDNIIFCVLHHPPHPTGDRECSGVWLAGAFPETLSLWRGSDEHRLFTWRLLAFKIFTDAEISGNDLNHFMFGFRSERCEQGFNSTATKVVHRRILDALYSLQFSWVTSNALLSYFFFNSVSFSVANGKLIQLYFVTIDR